jgi:hypothetical protein
MRIGKIALVLFLYYALGCTTYAAFNDVSLETATALNVGEYTLTIEGSTATLSSITVTATSLVVSLESESSIEIASADRVTLAHDADESLVTYTTACDGTESRLELSAIGSSVVTITPSGTCTPSTSGNTGTRLPQRTNTDESPSAPSGTTSYATLLEQLQSLVAALRRLGVEPSEAVRSLIDGTFQSYLRDLTFGSTGEDVRRLQQYLIANATGPNRDVLARIGVTGFFGTATQAALAEFQERVGIAPALGYFGPKTRAYILAH